MPELHGLVPLSNVNLAVNNTISVSLIEESDPFCSEIGVSSLVSFNREEISAVSAKTLELVQLDEYSPVFPFLKDSVAVNIHLGEVIFRFSNSGPNSHCQLFSG